MSSEPLITLGDYGGDGVGGRFPPDFILLPNGQLFFVRIEPDRWSLQTVNLSRQETCRLLNSVDQAGFYDYDSTTYIVDPQIQGASTTYISVQAWRSKRVDLYGLSIFINDLDRGCQNCYFPTLLPAIVNTYHLLKNYQPENSIEYQADRLAVWVRPGDSGAEGIVPWPLKTIKLSEEISHATVQGWPDFILQGDEAKLIWQLYVQSPGPADASFSEDNKIYSIEVEELLPHQYLSEPPVPISISCSPSDGLIAIP